MWLAWGADLMPCPEVPIGEPGAHKPLPSAHVLIHQIKPLSKGTWKLMLKNVRFLVLHLTKESIQCGQVFCKAEFWLLRQTINVQARTFSCMSVYFPAVFSWALRTVAVPDATCCHMHDATCDHVGTGREGSV